MGNVLNAGFDQVFNMYNQLVIETGDIIDTYVYRVGITNMQFSLATGSRSLQICCQLRAGCYFLCLMLTSLLITRFSKEGRNYDRKQEFWQ